MANRCRRLPTPSRRERKRPQRIASPPSEPVLRPTPTPVNVSLGAIAHSAPIPKVLRTHLFSVAWLLRSLRVGDRDIRLTVVNEPGRGRSPAFRSRLPPPSVRILMYSAHRPIEAYGGDSGPLPSPLHL